MLLLSRHPRYERREQGIRVDAANAKLKELIEEIGRVMVGQRSLVEGLLIGLLAGGHVLVEGVPGLAKTTAVRTLAQPG